MNEGGSTRWHTDRDEFFDLVEFNHRQSRPGIESVGIQAQIFDVVLLRFSTRSIVWARNVHFGDVLLRRFVRRGILGAHLEVVVSEEVVEILLE